MRIIRSILFFIIAIWSFVLSDRCFDKEIGFYETNSIYGGDAFTGMQNASAQTSKNTYSTNRILADGFGYVLLISGLGFLACSVTGFKKD